MRPRLAIRENYGFLLAGLLVLLLVVPAVRTFPALAENSRPAKVAVMIGFSLMMMIGVWSLHRQGWIFRVGLALAVLSTGFSVVEIFIETRVLDVGAGILVLIFSIVSGYVAARHVFTSTRVDRNILYGGVCVYLLMGLVWAILYGLIAELAPSSFQGFQVIDGKIPFDNLLYYSFVTLPSLGYGDIIPVAPLARTLAYLEAIAGQFYIAILVAGLVGMYMRDRGL